MSAVDVPTVPHELLMSLESRGYAVTFVIMRLFRVEMFKNEEHAMTPPSHPGLPADIYIPVDEYVIRSNRK